MQRETGFQTAVKAAFRAIGWYPESGTTTPGFPDITAISSGNVILVELKDITGISKAHKVSVIFKRAQIPFALRFIANNTGWIYLAIRDNRDFMVYVINSVSKVTGMVGDAKISSIVELSVKFKSVKEMVSYIIEDNFYGNNKRLVGSRISIQSSNKKSGTGTN